MKFSILCLTFLFSFLSISAFAGNNLKGNGFPSGTHYNLNILGKQDHFNCPAPSYNELGQQEFGNTIFFPREQKGMPISILMESGKKGPKSAPTTSKLEVTDWCTESFADHGSNSGDAASLRLPANDRGYKVYARITGKPSDEDINRSFATTSELKLVQDEAGNDLLELGLVSSDGVFSSDGVLITRNDTSRKGKGVQKATDITSLFEWSGDACYVQSDSDLYCLDEAGNNTCTTLNLCCVDENLDGVYERCDQLSDVGIDPDLNGTLECPTTDALGNIYLDTAAQCQSYDQEWVFNIGDFVDVLWNIENNGSYNVQIRFYPQ